MYNLEKDTELKATVKKKSEDEDKKETDPIDFMNDLENATEVTSTVEKESEDEDERNQNTNIFGHDILKTKVYIATDLYKNIQRPYILHYLKRDKEQDWQEIMSYTFPSSSGSLSSSDLSTKNQRLLDVCIKDKRIENEFTQLERIGEGGYGIVLKAKHKSDEVMYALKLNILYLGEDEKGAFSEVKILASLNHPRIIRYNTCWFLDVNTEEIFSNMTSAESSIAKSVRSTGNDICFLHSEEGIISYERNIQSPIARSKDAIKSILCIQMEYCHQTLKEFIEKGTVHDNPDERNRIFKEIVEGLKYIHKQNIIHRDLKPNNIFLDKFASVKIGDFGLSRHFAASKDTTETEKPENGNKSFTKGIGTGFYISPEIMSGDSRYSNLVDLYSLGIIIFEMYYPLNSHHERVETLTGLREKQTHIPEDFDTFVKQPEIVKQLIAGLLQHNQEERLNADEVLEILDKLETEEGMYEDEDSKNTDLNPTCDCLESDILFRPFDKSIGMIYQRTVITGISSCFRIGSKYLLSSFSRINKYSRRHLIIKFSGGGVTYRLTKGPVWKSNKFDIAILCLELSGTKDSMPPALEIGQMNELTSHNVYYAVSKFNWNENIEFKESDLNTDKTNTYIKKVLPYPYFGSPVFHLQKDNTLAVCGIASGIIYEKGVKAGTSIVTMKEIFESLDPIIPRSLRKDLFSDTEFYRCHENLMDKVEKILLQKDEQMQILRIKYRQIQLEKTRETR